MSRLFAFPRLPRPSTIVVALLTISIVATATDAAAVRRHARPRHKPTAAAPSAARAQRPTARPAQRPTAPIVLPGMIVAIDPETGALVLPTPEQRLALMRSAPGSAPTPAERAGLMRTSEGLTQQQLPDGTVMVHLQGRFREFTTISIGASGRPTFQCVHDSTALRRILGSRPPTPTPAFEER
ncbi:MAG TPA: hypothetical protein VMS88_01585 [Terriglobales bacterium]|nr:hypothetical protein [Terriglobales bacterium]